MKPSKESKNSEQILLLAVDKLQVGLNDLITACQKEGGPSRQEIARAKALLSGKYSNSFETPKERGK